MLLLNTTDDAMTWPAAVRPPLVNGPEEQFFPPRFFTFEPGETVEVQDDAAEVLLEHLAPRGLVRVQLNEDPTEARANGRRSWFDWLEAQVRRHQTINDELRANGRAPIRPNRFVRRHAKTYERLAKAEFADSVLDVAIREGQVTDQVQLSEDPALVAAAARARARDAALEAEEAPQA
jgi:hypothetical protein